MKLVRTFGSIIHSTVSAGPSSVGVDLQAEQRYYFSQTVLVCYSILLELSSYYVILLEYY